MPLKNVIQVNLADPIFGTINGYSSHLIDATGEKCATIFQIPKSGSITHVGFRTATVTTPQTLRVGIETLTTGAPSGSQYGGSAVGTQASPASNTYYEVALATPATAVRGDFVAIVVQFNSTIGNLNIAHCTGSPNHALPFVSDFTAAWVNVVRTPVASLKYADGTYPDFFCIPAASITELNYNSGSTPDERALKFTLPFPCALRGVYMRAAMSAGATADIVLYDPNGTTVLNRLSVSQVNLMGTFDDPVKFIFSAPTVLKQNVAYRLAYQATNGTGIWLYQFAVNNAAMLDSFQGGQNFHLSTRTNLGAWTDTTTSRPYIGLLLEKIHDGQVSDFINL